MRYEARLTAFDMLDQVHVTVGVWLTGESALSRPELVLSNTTTVQGEGESDPSQWARDCLIAALESL